MLLTNLKIIFRSLIKQRVYSFINILSLFIGLGSFFIIYLYVVDELSYDTSFENSDDTYRVLLEENFHGEIQKTGKTPIPLSTTLKSEFPEVKSFTAIGNRPSEVVKVSENGSLRAFNESNVLAVDGNFLTVFPFKLKSGDSNSVLTEPFSIVLTSEMADKYFPNGDPMGKSLTLGEKDPEVFKVTGVLEEIKERTHLEFSLLTSITSYPEVEDMKWSWIFNILTTYVQLEPGTDPEFVNSKFPGIVQKNLPATFNKIRLSFDEFMNEGGKWKYELQPLEDIWLHSDGIGNPLGRLGDIKYVLVFSLIGLFLLFVACINYINLATALSARKSKEVGLYKTFGVQNGALFKQLMVEPFMFSFFALFLSFIAVSLSIDYINQIIDKELSVGSISDPYVFLPLLAIVSITSLLAGFYPAYKFTTVNPIEVLKSNDFSGRAASGKKAFDLRKPLVIFQFVLSNVLFASALIVGDQLDLLQEADVGFDKENVILISNADKLGNNVDPFINKLKSQTFVENISISSSLPSKNFHSNWYTPEESSVDNVEITSALVDENAIPLLAIDLIKGRTFSKDMNERRTIIINNTLAKNLKWEDPIGQKIVAGDDGAFEVIGVVKDFNYVSLREKIKPFAFFHYSSNLLSTGEKYISIKVKGDNWAPIISEIETTWLDFSGSIGLEYTFLKEDYNLQYRGEQNVNAIVNYFTILCIVVACLGLYGLVAFSVQKKQKEVGIRKVLGASASSVVNLFLKEFIVILCISLVIAIPITYFLMAEWLNNFEYRTNINFTNFLFAGIVTILIAVLTVVFKTYRAAQSDPAKMLKYE